MKIREPLFFMLFGIFHMHRIWALLDRESYAVFWLDILQSKGAAYYLLMIMLGGLSILGIHSFFRNFSEHLWWRWIYISGGAYVLFDITAIALDIDVWHSLLMRMFDTSAPYWDMLWLCFILMGLASFSLGTKLLIQFFSEKHLF